MSTTGSSSSSASEASSTRIDGINRHEDSSTIITVTVVVCLNHKPCLKLSQAHYKCPKVSFIVVGIAAIFLFLRITAWSRRRSEEKRGFASLNAGPIEKRRGMFGKSPGNRRKFKNAFAITEPYAGFLDVSKYCCAEWQGSQRGKAALMILEMRERQSFCPFRSKSPFNAFFGQSIAIQCALA